MGQIFGPVPSRRLGFSLGIDIIPFKTCTLDCVYCQLGRTTNKTVQRKEYVASDNILREIEEVLKQEKKIDYITFSGSGEPALNSKIGKMIAQLKRLTSIPIAILTNGTLLSQPEVEEELMKADLVIPSLDAVSKEIFEKINRPHPSLRINKVISGLDIFSCEFKGKVWLEIMVVKGMNDFLGEIKKIAEATKKMKLDKIHLNTIVRPPGEDFAQPVSIKDLEKMKRILGKKCEIITEFTRSDQRNYESNKEKMILAMLKRRPVTLLDISQSLGLSQNEVIKYLEVLKRDGQILAKVYKGKRYYWR